MTTTLLSEPFQIHHLASYLATDASAVPKFEQIYLALGLPPSKFDALMSTIDSVKLTQWAGFEGMNPVDHIYFFFGFRKVLEWWNSRNNEEATVQAFIEIIRNCGLGHLEDKLLEDPLKVMYNKIEVSVWGTPSELEDDRKMRAWVKEPINVNKRPSWFDNYEDENEEDENEEDENEEDEDENEDEDAYGDEV